MSANTPVRVPASWVPTLYLAMGIPFAKVNWVVASMFKDMGCSDTGIHK